MTEVNLNHAKFDERMAFVQKTLTERLRLVSTKIDTLAYTPSLPFAFNNFLYLVKLTGPAPSRKDGVLPVTAVPIPPDANQLVMRLTNADPRTGLNNRNRVQNEVAGMSLARSALKGTTFSHIVPTVYDWEAGDGIDGGEQGWILMEYKMGTTWEEKPWRDLSAEQQAKLIDQVAEVFRALKSHPLPDGLQGIGGLTFDDKGRLAMSEMTLLPGGPYPTYAAMWTATIENALTSADESPALVGWRDSDLRDRLDRFAQSGISKTIESLRLEQKLVYNHSDFGVGNVLFDEKTIDLTALLDFDWGYIGLQYDDYLRCLHTVYGAFPGGSAVEGEEAALRQAMLDGFPEGAVLGDKIEDHIARLWDGALERAGVARPRTLHNIDKLAEIKTFIDNIAPFELVQPPIINRLGGEKVKAKKETTRRALEEWLTQMGY